MCSSAADMANGHSRHKTKLSCFHRSQLITRLTTRSCSVIFCQALWGCLHLITRTCTQTHECTTSARSDRWYRFIEKPLGKRLFWYKQEDFMWLTNSFQDCLPLHIIYPLSHSDLELEWVCPSFWGRNKGGWTSTDICQAAFSCTFGFEVLKIKPDMFIDTALAQRNCHTEDFSGTWQVENTANTVMQTGATFEMCS